MLAQDDNVKEAIAAYEKCAQFYQTENDTTYCISHLVLYVSFLAPTKKKKKKKFVSIIIAFCFFSTLNMNNIRNANKRLLKVAHLAPKTQNYERAIEIFESVAKDSVDNNLLRWKVKEYLYKSLICQLCAGAADDIKNWSKMEQIADRYKDISDIYATSREAKFLDVCKSFFLFYVS